MTTIAELRREAEEAIAGHKGAVAGLYRDGVAKYDEERMNEMRAHYDSERDKALRSIEEAASEIARRAAREAEAAAQFAPDLILDGAERGYVASRQQLVAGDVAGMDTGELALKLHFALHAGSRSTKYLYWQAARRRRRELLESRARSSREAARDRG